MAIRPWLIWSILLAILAMTPGARKPGLTAVIISILSVTAANALAVDQASSWSSPGSTGFMKCSAISKVSKPSRSANSVARLVEANEASQVSGRVEIIQLPYTDGQNPNRISTPLLEAISSAGYVWLSDVSMRNAGPIFGSGPDPDGASPLPFLSPGCYTNKHSEKMMTRS